MFKHIQKEKRVEGGKETGGAIGTDLESPFSSREFYKRKKIEIGEKKGKYSILFQSEGQL